ncbi:hypothetical protein V9T40_002220 [Parthenolecanium corni]|uniref:MD-2-related lipid-recognition domain-containing protein n=1 Tax=Parthenolecanium corni TaxID=536013 RepID=A0AAN9TU43_9HEMI
MTPHGPSSNRVKPGVSSSGYKLHVDYFRNCGKNDVVQLSDDFQPTLNDDCSVTLWGCTTVKHAFKSAQMTYEISRNGVLYSGTKNACDALEGAHGEVLAIMDSVGAPRTCPIKDGTICGHGKHVNIRKHRIKLPVMSGTTTGRVELKTNSGDACFEFSATLSRRLFSG